MVNNALVDGEVWVCPLLYIYIHSIACSRICRAPLSNRPSQWARAGCVHVSELYIHLQIAVVGKVSLRHIHITNRLMVAVLALFESCLVLRAGVSITHNSHAI